MSHFKYLWEEYTEQPFQNEKEQICTKSEILYISWKEIWHFIYRLNELVFPTCNTHFYASFPTPCHKLQNPAGKMLFSGRNFLTWYMKCLEFKAVFLSHHKRAVTSMQNIMKNAIQCYMVENEIWVCIYKNIKLNFKVHTIRTKKI